MNTLMGTSKSQPAVAAAAGGISSISLADAGGDSDDEDEVPDMVVLGGGQRRASIQLDAVVDDDDCWLKAATHHAGGLCELGVYSVAHSIGYMLSLFSAASPRSPVAARLIFTWTLLCHHLCSLKSLLCAGSVIARAVFLILGLVLILPTLRWRSGWILFFSLVSLIPLVPLAPLLIIIVMLIMRRLRRDSLRHYPIVVTTELLGRLELTTTAFHSGMDLLGGVTSSGGE
jgi:hypothetical protein